LEKALSQKQQANVCTSSTPTEYGSASPAGAPADDVSTGSDDVTGDCGDVGEVAPRDAALLPVTKKKAVKQHGVKYLETH